MEMSSVQLVPGSRETVWTALNDQQLLKACIPGCESMEPDGENAYKVAMKVKVGPVNAKFAGRIQMADLNPPNSYTLTFEGQGGVAGFAKGSAQVALAPGENAGGTESGPESTKLEYTARAQVGGKLAQIGSRLIDGAAKKMAADFFTAFAKELEARRGADAAAS